MNPDAADFQSTIDAAVKASQADDSETALKLLGKACELHPGSGLAHFLIGSEYAYLGRLDQAEASFASAVLLEPSLVLARYQLGLLQFSSGRAATALLTWQPLLELPDDEPYPHFVKGFACLAQDQFDEAEGHYHRGLAHVKDNRALAGDIEQVLLGIRKITEAGKSPPSEGESTHLLVSAYSRGLH
jgi:tetratricopeptide (TPR) repeat protein